MTAQGEDILAWLDNAISLREQAARDADQGEWTPEPDRYEDWEAAVASASAPGGCVANCQPEEARHIAANSPASVLRRCAADRKLLKLHGGNMHSCPATDETDYLDEWTHFGYEDHCPVIVAIAEGYGWTEGEL